MRSAALEYGKAILRFPDPKETPMLKHRTFVAITMLASVALAVVPAAVRAATSTTVAPPAPVVSPPKPPPKPPRLRAPLAPPPMNDVSYAYEFRTQLSGNPECQRFATESDNVFLNSQLDDAQKVIKLKALGAEAKANNCLAPATAY